MDKFRVSELKPGQYHYIPHASQLIHNYLRWIFDAK